MLLTMHFDGKITVIYLFKIKLFIGHFSFITLAQKTSMRLQIVRFLETFRRTGPFLELKLKCCFCT